MSARLLAIDRQLDPKLVERFQSDLAALWSGSGKLGIAVSGGPDSLALLLLAYAAIPGRIEAATVDHGLRAESAAEAEHVAQICAQLGIPHKVFAVEVADGNVQAMARDARYGALSMWTVRRGLTALATAHHADDQAETLLMRLNRGSGLSGLSGVRAKSWASTIDPPGEFDIIRPLLGWRKEELIAVVEASEFESVQDPSNEDESFDRVRIRGALANQDWLDPLAIAKSAGLLGEMLHDIEWMLAADRADSIIEEDGCIIYKWGGGEMFEIEQVRWILERLGGSAARSQIATMIERLRGKQNASLSGILARPILYETAPDTFWTAWKFEAEPRRNSA